MQTHLATIGQLERSLAQNIRRLYRTQLGRNPGEVVCQLKEQHLTVVVEDSVTAMEKTLILDNQSQVANQFRANLESVLLPQLQTVIEDTLEAKVLDVVGSSMMQTNSTGVFALLDRRPRLRIAPQAS